MQTAQTLMFLPIREGRKWWMKNKIPIFLYIFKDYQWNQTYNKIKNYNCQMMLSLARKRMNSKYHTQPLWSLNQVALVSTPFRVNHWVKVIIASAECKSYPFVSCLELKDVKRMTNISSISINIFLIISFSHIDYTTKPVLSSHSREVTTVAA